MYTIKQAAQRSGVNVALLRAWERRYAVVAPTRTESGYRLYDDAAIDRLRAMRALVDEGWSPRQAADRIAGASVEEVAELADRGETRLESDGEAEPTTSDLTAAFVDGATRIDAVTIERALDEMFARGTFERIVEDRLYPALHALGDGWARGDVDVAGEHAASAAAVRRLSLMFEAAGTPDGGAPILVGLPPGSRHEVASLAFATAARRAGLQVTYLGADVPAASWVAAAERTGARGVAFGVVMDEDVPGADAVVRALQATHPELVIAVGGLRAAEVGDGAVVRLPNRLLDAVATLREALGQA
jgi:MerR family transcriptional regulator, light-induced transcriptional regulator